MVRIHGTHLLKELSENLIWGARAYAINAYAGLEQSLCNLMRYLTGLEPDINGVIFFKIDSARSRTAILTSLLKKKHSDTHSVFFNSLIRLVQTLDQERNEIVHWHVRQSLTMDIDEGGVIKRDYSIQPGNFWNATERTPRKDVNAFIEFSRKCEFTSSLCFIFTNFLEGKLPVEKQPTLHDIFLQPVTYPPPDNHLLFQMWKAQEIQLQSSQE